MEQVMRPVLDKKIDYMQINQHQNVEIFELIKSIYESMDKRVFSHDEITKYLKNLSKLNINLESKERLGKFDEGIIDVVNLQNVDDNIFYIDKDKLKELNKCIIKNIKKLDQSLKNINFHHYSLMHYNDVHTPRPIHRDSKRTVQWKLFIPIAKVNKNKQGHFWFVPQTSFITSRKREIISSLKGDISRIFDFPDKQVFNPIPYNYFLSNQTCLHGDKCLDGPISRSMLCLNYT